MESAFHFRDLMAGHRPSTASPSRVGSIIQAIRPALILDRDNLPDQPEIVGLSINSRLLLQRRVAEIAPSVGAVEVHDGNAWKRLGTCFRVTANKMRVATARHMLRALLRPGIPIECAPDSLPVALGAVGPFRQARVIFESFDGTANSAIDISGIEWAHPKWDLMLLKLAGESDRSGLAIAHEHHDALDLSHEICVIGYPNPSNAASSANAFSGVFDGALGVKRASFGLRRRPSEGVFGHDASTLPGNSGSPIVCLETGQILGVHYFGGSGTDDPNRGVFFPEALSERHLCARMVDGIQSDNSTPAAWPNVPRFRFGQSLSNIRSDGEELSAEDKVFTQTEALMPDRKDIRDRFYQPPLQTAQHAILPEKLSDIEIANQADPYSCTGFALAAAINKELRAAKQTKDQRVSAAMIYALATQNDEFVDDLPGGSSLRGAIKGLYHFGVCLENTAPYTGYDPGWHLTIKSAKEARNFTLGAYYRLNPVLTDYQLAIQEAGAVVVSAHIHAGWKRGARPVKRLSFKPGRIGAHAFALVGYDDRGFILQNSWGKDWGEWKGRKGHAHWSYADWAANVIDGWVLRLAPQAPEAFSLQVRQGATRPEPETKTDPIARLPDPRRFALIGHTIHAEREGIRDYSRVGIGAQSLRETALFLASATGCKKYPQLALIFHDPTLGDDAIARISSNMIAPFKANGIYPLHIAYGIDEMRSLIVRMQDESRTVASRANGAVQDLTAFLNRRAVKAVRPMLQSWQDGIDIAVQPGGGLWQSLASIGIEAARLANNAGPRSVHILSFGSGWAAASKAIEAGANFGFNGFASIGRIAPTFGSNPVLAKGTRAKDWFLSAPASTKTVLPNYTGDWVDLFAALFPELPARPRLKSAATIGADLASVCFSPKVMNSALKLMLNRNPAPTRRFV